MPTYQYTCTGCDERTEVVQRFTDDPLTECAACGGRLRKVFSPVGIVFKGSGFYRNDSRAAGNGATNGSKAEQKDTGTDTDTGKEPATSGGSSSTSQSDGGAKSGESKSSDSAGTSGSGGKSTEKVA